MIYNFSGCDIANYHSMVLGDKVLCRCRISYYSWYIVQLNEVMNKDITSRVKTEWLKWRSPRDCFLIRQYHGDIKLNFIKLWVGHQFYMNLSLWQKRLLISKFVMEDMKRYDEYVIKLRS